MQVDSAGKAAIVSGGSSGGGEATCLALGRPREKRHRFLRVQQCADTIVALLEYSHLGHGERKARAAALPYHIDEAGSFERLENVIRIWKE